MKQQLKNDLIYFLLLSFKFLAGLLPYRLLLPLGWALGNLAHALTKKERERARTHLHQAFPEWEKRSVERTALRVFQELGKNALELFAMLNWPSAKIAGLVNAVEGREHLEAALAEGRGVICLTAHYGNWEIMPVFTSAQGWATAVVAQKLYDERLDTLLNRAREAHGIRVIKRGELTREIIRALRANSLLGVLNDQDTRVDARWAPFFGRPAKTPIGLFRLARRIGSPILPMFIERHSGWGHRLVIHPALAIAWSEDEEADLATGARLANAAIEKQIRHSPAQWVWFHQRWKSQPTPAPAGEIGGAAHDF